MLAETFDYIIVGAGSAGCVVASRLARDRNHKVCVLEAGPMDRNPYIHIPAGFIKTVHDPRINWLYQTEPGEWTGGRRISQPRGKVVGGSGAINGHVFNRGQACDFDGWLERGNTGWGYTDVLPYFKRLETYHGTGNSVFRGSNGPFQVTELNWQHPLTDAFIQSARELGIPANTDYNGANQAGVFPAQRSIYRGRRCSPAQAYLHPALSTGNIDLRPNALATKILFDNGRAKELCYYRGGQQYKLEATREIILCGGVFNTPQLLQLSGVGSSETLNDLAIPVVHHLPGVGQNLRDHCYIPVSARVRNIKSLNERSRGIPLCMEVLKYVFGRRGLLALQPSLCYLSWKSHPELTDNDIQIAYAPASYDTSRDMQLNDYPGVTCAPWQHVPKSKGLVQVCSRDALDPPRIQPNYLQEPSDREVLLAAARLSRDILSARAFSDFFESEDQPGNDVNTDDEWYDYMRQSVSTGYHPVGTCRMAPVSDPTAVVDSELKVHGIQALRVVDASVMPNIPSGNTHASTLMIAEKGSDMILGKPPLPAAEL